MFLPAFKNLKFVDYNKPIYKKLMYWSFALSKKKCDKWDDFDMNVAPYKKDEPIYYEFTKCPIADFAREHNLPEVMPAMCNPDYTAMELIHARLVRKTTCERAKPVSSQMALTKSELQFHATPTAPPIIKKAASIIHVP